MKISYWSKPIREAECDAVIVPVFSSETFPDSFAACDTLFGGRVRKLWESKVFTGKELTCFTLTPSTGISASFLILAGLGKQEDLTPEVVRQSFAHTYRNSPLSRCASVGISREHFKKCGLTSAALEGLALASYKFDKYQTNDDKDEFRPLSHVILTGEPCTGDLENEVNNVVRWVDFCRDLANEPANVLNPKTFSEIGRKLAAELGVEYGLLDAAKLHEKKMNAILAVGGGSATQPAIFWLRYNGDSDSNERLALVGKGLTFDSGGISIKPAEGMDAMKGDMGGAAAVIGAFGLIASMKLKINVDCVIGAAENMPSGSAYRPGDIIRAYNGKTIEVLNTDAEGRVVLADTLAFAVKDLGATKVIDVATLTGAAGVALGNVCTALVTNNDDLLSAFRAAADTTGERVWQMPSYPEYKKLIKSKIADIKNTGGRGGGAITAALFLENFVDSKPWLHVDIAPTALSPNAETSPPYVSVSHLGTGVMVRTIYAYAKACSK